VFYVYVLRSESDSGFYIGFSTNLRARLRQHQDGESLATKSRGPWKLIYYEAYTEREDAEGREKFLKSGAGRRLKLGRFPHSLAALPSMSLIPFAPFLRAQLRHYLQRFPA
jgi:putative endonuclease